MLFAFGKMHDHVENQSPNKKKNLKKVRRAFLNKTADLNEVENEALIAPLPKKNKSYMIASTLGLGVVDSKIHIDTRFLNVQYNINSISLQEQYCNKLVSLNLQIKEEIKSQSWEDATKVLEEQKDEVLHQWAQRIRNYYTVYPKLIKDYFDLMRTNNPKILMTLRKMKSRATVACREIEEKCTYQKALFFSNQHSTELLASCYSEAFLKEIDYTVDAFILHVKANGLPVIFESDSEKLLDVAKNYLECTTLIGEPVQEMPEYSIHLFTCNGEKKNFLVQYTLVVEPTPEGIFVSGYFIIKKRLNETGDSSHISHDINLKEDPGIRSYKSLLEEANQG